LTANIGSCGAVAVFVCRIQSVETAIGLLKNLQTSLILEETWVETQTQKLKLLPTISNALDLDVSID
jgi:hypothetical protein